MTTRLADQITVLQRMAAFAARVRNHELGEWRTAGGSSSACCTRCGAELRVYFPALQPEMDGPALEDTCASPRMARSPVIPREYAA